MAYNPQNNINSGYNTNAYNYGQYNATGYDTSPYGRHSVYSMSLAQAAWKNAWGDYSSPIPGVSNVEYAESVKRRSDLFWDNLYKSSAVAALEAGTYAFLNIGPMFSSIGASIGGLDYGKAAKLYPGTLRQSAGLYADAFWSGKYAGIGKGMHRLGMAMEFNPFTRFAYYDVTQSLFNGLASDIFNAPFEAMGGMLENRAMNAFSSGRRWLGLSQEAFYAPRNTVSAFLSKVGQAYEAGEGGLLTTTLGDLSQAMFRNPFSRHSNNIYNAMSSYISEKGIMPALTKTAIRGVTGLGSMLAWYMGTGALIDMLGGAAYGTLYAGDLKTKEAELQLQSIKKSFLSDAGLADADRTIKKIADVIRTKSELETGVTGSIDRAFRSKVLDEAIGKRTAMYSLFSAYGLTGKSDSADEFIEKASKLEEAVKKLSQAFKISTAEAVDMIRVMKSQGIGTNNFATAGLNTGLTASFAGYTPMQVMSIQSHGTEAMRGSMFSPELGVGIANDVIQKTSIAAEEIPTWNKTLFSMRGKDSLNVFLTESMSALAKSQDMRKLFIASLFKKQGNDFVFTGKVNADAIAAASVGNSSYITNRAIQDELVSRYLNNLTTAQRNTADLAVQQATGNLSSAQFNGLLENVFSAAGYKNKEAGLAAYFAKQGLSPQVAADLAKAMNKTTGTNLLAMQYRQTEMANLNMQLAGPKGNSLLYSLGSEYSLGMLGTAFKYAGMVSNKLFGSNAKAAETAMLAGVSAGLMAPSALSLLGGEGVGAMLGDVFSVAASTGTLAYNYMQGMQHRNTVAHLLGYKGGLSTFGMLKHMSLSSVGSLAMITALPELGAKTFLALPGAYLSGGMAEDTAQLLGLNNEYGNKEVQTFGKVGLRAAYSGALTYGGLSMLAPILPISLPIGALALTSAAIGASMGYKDLLSQQKQQDLLKRKQHILDTYRSVLGLSKYKRQDLAAVRALMQKEFTGNEAVSERGVGSIGMTGAYASVLKQLHHDFMSGNMSEDEVFVNIAQGLNQLSGFNVDLQEGAKSAADNSIWYMYTGTPASAYTDYISSLYGKSKSVNLSRNLKLRQTLQGLAVAYKYGTPIIRRAIEKQVGHLPASSLNLAGVTYKNTLSFIKSMGSSAYTDPAGAESYFNNLLDEIGYSDRSSMRISLAESSRIGALLANESASLAKQYSKLDLEGTAEILGSKYGVDEDKVAALLTYVTKMDAESIHSLGLRFGVAGARYEASIMAKRIREIFPKELGTAEDSSLAISTLTDLSLGYRVSKSSISQTIKLLNKSKSSRMKRISALLARTVTLREQMKDFGAEPLSYEEYAERFGDDAILNKSTFSRIAGEDNLMSMKELSDYVYGEQLQNSLTGILADSKKLAPNNPIESIDKHVKIIADYIDELKHGKNGKKEAGAQAAPVVTDNGYQSNIHAYSGI